MHHHTSVILNLTWGKYIKFTLHTLSKGWGYHTVTSFMNFHSAKCNGKQKHANALWNMFIKHSTVYHHASVILNLTGGKVHKIHFPYFVKGLGVSLFFLLIEITKILCKRVGVSYCNKFYELPLSQVQWKTKTCKCTVEYVHKTQHSASPCICHIELDGGKVHKNPLFILS